MAPVTPKQASLCPPGYGAISYTSWFIASGEPTQPRTEGNNTQNVTIDRNA